MDDITNNLRQKGEQLQEALSHEKIIIEKNGVKLVIDAAQKINELVINEVPSDSNLIEILNEGIKRTQEIAANKFLEISAQK